jgi:O-antigen ligase
MTALELALLGLCILAALFIFLTEAFRARGRASAKLPPSMILFLRITLGIVFAILGVIGSLLPIMQGWIFFLLAVLVLFPQSSFAVKSCDKIERKMPRLVARLRRWGIGVPRAEDHDQAVRSRVL